MKRGEDEELENKQKKSVLTIMGRRSYLCLDGVYTASPFHASYIEPHSSYVLLV